jgi:glycosyltransferase involved in cell wall biosynthesis
MTQRLRAVFISPIAPARSGNGLAMRMGLFAEALSRIAELDIIVVPIAGQPPNGGAFLRDAGVGHHCVNIEGRSDTHFSLLSRISDERQRLEAFCHYGRPSLCRALSAPVLDDIARIVQARKPNLVHIGRSYLMPCANSLPANAVATVDLDEDDQSNFISQARVARNDRRPIYADWLRQEGLACDALVAQFSARFQRLYVASRKDGAQISRRHPGLVCETAENAIHLPRRAEQRDDGETLTFVGSLGYAPNSEGVVWFVREMLPRIRTANGASCRLLIAGSHPPAAVRGLARHPRVTVLDWVPDLTELYRRTTLALAPLRAGGGTRIKLLEAAAHRVASVSTEVANEGLDWPDELGGWRADSPAAFARCCRIGLSSPIERRRRADDALRWVGRHHAKEVLVARLSRSFSALAH